ncbi:MAG: 3-oxoacyl-ACP reductase FabG [bacterium]|nr:3-oxoacyl-ACP reductase FabG [bacterium]
MRKVLITGGSRGIGAACVRRFSAEGFEVYFNYTSNDKAAKKIMEETGAQGFKCNVSNSLSVKKMINMIGGVDILINNAGISRINLFTDISEKEWDEVFDVNIKGMFLVTKEVLPHMIRSKYGRIVNISSMWGISGGSCEVHYSASKAAVIGFTKALAKEEGPSGITVNCVAPGVIKTEMNARLDDEAVSELEEETPLMRLGTPEEVANAVYFLTSDDASFITGQVLCADGGITV